MTLDLYCYKGFCIDNNVQKHIIVDECSNIKVENRRQTRKMITQITFFPSHNIVVYGKKCILENILYFLPKWYHCILYQVHWFEFLFKLLHRRYAKLIPGSLAESTCKGTLWTECNCDTFVIISYKLYTINNIP